MFQSIKLNLKSVFFIYKTMLTEGTMFTSNTLFKKTKESLFTFSLLSERELKLCVLYFSTPFYNTADLKKQFFWAQDLERNPPPPHANQNPA